MPQTWRGTHTGPPDVGSTPISRDRPTSAVLRFPLRQQDHASCPPQRSQNARDWFRWSVSSEYGRFCSSETDVVTSVVQVAYGSGRLGAGSDYAVMSCWMEQQR
jgi:hypothetical protein